MCREWDVVYEIGSAARSARPPPLQTAFFFGYNLMVCFGFFLMLGSIGFASSLLFVRTIFRCGVSWAQRVRRHGCVWEEGAEGRGAWRPPPFDLGSKLPGLFPLGSRACSWPGRACGSRPCQARLAAAAR